ncbi:MAG TPA: hypothetical protein VFR24_27260 [Candidatus Angelobacter sp.]|nr:hypothetical protein [Candidatus Angelobacter sp.]
MKNILLIGVTIAYVGQAAVYGFTGDWKQALIIGGYAIANCGLIATVW